MAGEITNRQPQQVSAGLFGPAQKGRLGIELAQIQVLSEPLQQDVTPMREVGAEATFWASVVQVSYRVALNLQLN